MDSKEVKDGAQGKGKIKARAKITRAGFPCQVSLKYMKVIATSHSSLHFNFWAIPPHQVWEAPPPCQDWGSERGLWYWVPLPVWGWQVWPSCHHLHRQVVQVQWDQLGKGIYRDFFFLSLYCHRSFDFLFFFLFHVSFFLLSISIFHLLPFLHLIFARPHNSLILLGLITEIL